MEHEGETCEPLPRRGGKKRSVLLMTLLCAHCSLTLVAALAALTLTAIPASIALGMKWVLPPFFLVGLFLIYISPQWRRARVDAANALPIDEKTPPARR